MYEGDNSRSLSISKAPNFGAINESDPTDEGTSHDNSDRLKSNSNLDLSIRAEGNNPNVDIRDILRIEERPKGCQAL
jgi:hypothetical protein